MFCLSRAHDQITEQFLIVKEGGLSGQAGDYVYLLRLGLMLTACLLSNSERSFRDISKDISCGSDKGLVTHKCIFFGHPC